MKTQIPPLENGDRMNRYEFEARSSIPTAPKKLELINGVVFMAAALRYRSHGLPHSYIMGWLALYAANTPGVELADNATIRLDVDNEPQPDALLRIETDFGGQSQISKDDYIEGAPELIVEIAGSTFSYDLHDKLEVYRRHGVKEYIVWRVYDHQIDWLYLREGRYISLLPNEMGLIESKTFPGLVLALESMLEHNLLDVLAQQQEQLKCESYVEFCRRLNNRDD